MKTPQIFLLRVHCTIVSCEMQIKHEKQRNIADLTAKMACVTLILNQK